MGPKVLVVDDDPAIRKVLSTTFALEDYEVVLATDGAEAIEAVVREMPDIVILDVMMPKHDGFEVLGKIRQDRATQDIPVILLTARSSQQDVWEGWRKGVDYYVTKPFDVEELLRFMEYVLTGGDAPTPPNA